MMINAQAPKSGHGLRMGQAVFHTKFGEGVVITLEGWGADTRAQVNFGRHGPKWLALSVAKLTPVDRCLFGGLQCTHNVCALQELP